MAKKAYDFLFLHFTIIQMNMMCIVVLKLIFFIHLQHDQFLPYMYISIHRTIYRLLPTYKHFISNVNSYVWASNWPAHSQWSTFYEFVSRNFVVFIFFVRYFPYDKIPSLCSLHRSVQHTSVGTFYYIFFRRIFLAKEKKIEINAFTHWISSYYI